MFECLNVWNPYSPPPPYLFQKSNIQKTVWGWISNIQTFKKWPPEMFEFLNFWNPSPGPRRRLGGRWFSNIQTFKKWTPGMFECLNFWNPGLAGGPGLGRTGQGPRAWAEARETRIFKHSNIQKMAPGNVWIFEFLKSRPRASAEAREALNFKHSNIQKMDPGNVWIFECLKSQPSWRPWTGADGAGAQGLGGGYFPGVAQLLPGLRPGPGPLPRPPQSRAAS